MARKSFPVEIEPDVLRWVVKSSGWTEEEIGKKLNVGPDRVSGWLQGVSKPTLKDVEALSEVLKRPLAIFFLPSPPEDKPLPHDYRMLPEKAGIFSKKTLLVLRRARRIQTISRELMANLGTRTAASVGTASMSDDPESIAIRERDGFGITPEIQTNWRHSYDAFNAWREVLNAKNIMVFQMSMPIEDARGFTLADQEPFVIVVNSSDTIEARIFTLFHEYGHLLLKDAGICMPENAFRSMVQDGNSERWCNEFASAVLLPKGRLNVELGNLSKEELLDRSCLGGISRRYKVSKSALLLYMMKNRYITRIEYDAIHQRMKPGRNKSKGFSAIPAEKRVMQERGKKYISLVAKNVQNGNISKIDALEYLSIKLPSLDKVVAMAER